MSNTIKLIQEGNTYNINLKTYYCESNDDLNDIPANEPAGTIAIVNETDDFHMSMKQFDGSWNRM